MSGATAHAAVRGSAVDSAASFAESSPETTRTREVVYQDPMPTATVGATMAGIDYVEAIGAGEIPPPPMGVLMNLQPVEVSEGHAVFEGVPGEEHYKPMGMVHGGYASTLLDSAMGCAVHTTLPAGVAYSTATIEVKLVRPITAGSGRLRCEADVVHRGRMQATVEARAFSEDGKLVAHGTSTCLILEG
ncbi:MAG: PaaI family thioesterase [Solirubrobacterales bacterium]|nr:PaaI family thioesterase [Solirubrobacterales bacterium]